MFSGTALCMHAHKMAPSPSKLAKAGVHAKACQITCVSCYRRVATKWTNGELHVEGSGSQLITAFLCDLALVRWEEVWQYEQTASDR